MRRSANVQRCCILLAAALLQQQMENADAERDVYDELLTQAEIQGNVNKVNGKSHEHTHTHIYAGTQLSTDLFICLGFHGTVVKCQPLSDSEQRLECS